MLFPKARVSGKKSVVSLGNACEKFTSEIGKFVFVLVGGDFYPITKQITRKIGNYPLYINS